MFFKLSLGDWTLINLLIESLRKWKPFNIHQKSLSVNNFINKKIFNSNMCSSQKSINTISGGIVNELNEDYQYDNNLLNIEEKEILHLSTIQSNLNNNACLTDQCSTKNSSDTTKSVVGSQQNLDFDNF